MSTRLNRGCRQQGRDKSLPALPCHVEDPDLWFADNPADLERAKQLCADCPIRAQCLATALNRGEPWGVWGGQIFEQGVVIARKRPRGRPRKNPQLSPAAA
jgi:WhiB family redox-sensing transcriptional regulator